MLPALARDANASLERYLRTLAHQMAVAAAALTLLAVPAYQLIEFFQAGGWPSLWWQHVLWRAPALVLAIFALSWCLIRKDGYGAPVVLRLLTLTIMTMMFGLFATNYLSAHGNVMPMVHGLIMTTFAVSLVSLRGGIELLLIYTLPLTATLAGLAFLGASMMAVIGTLIDPLMMLAVGVIASELFYRTRLNAFAAHQELRKHASTDPLTGLSNRRPIQQQLRGEIAHARRRRNTFSILMADLDFFKRVNDQHGHDAGDAVLRELADRLRAALRQEDRAARWGGEEFLVLLTDTGAEQAGLVAEKIRRTVSDRPFEIGQHRLNLTISLGVAEYAGESDPEALVKRADQALYQAKSSGRNCVRIVQEEEAAA